MTPLADLPPVDRAQLMHQVDLQAFHDGRADAGTGDRTASTRNGIGRWAAQREAQIAGALAAETDLVQRRLREAEAQERSAAQAVADAAQEVTAAEQQRHRLRRVLRGEEPADDGGDWADTARLSEHPRRGRAGDALVYGAAAVADAGLNFLALRIMGVSAVETAVLAGAIVLVSVVLPKQLGEVAAAARRNRRWRGWPLALMLGGTGLWIATALFAATVRTGFLLLPTAVGRPPLLVAAGVGPAALTAGWLAVAVAVGAVVFLRSAHRHNPSATAWHENTADLIRLRAGLAALRGAETVAAGCTASARDRLETVGHRAQPLLDECRAVAAELVARYEHELGRQRASVEHRRSDVLTRSALPESLPESLHRIADGTP